MERAVRTFLAVQGVPTIPCNEFSGRNDTHQQAPTTYLFNEKSGRVERLVLPDLIRFPSFHAVEVKCQGYSPFMRRKVQTTGFLRRHYEHYRNYERQTQRTVELLFVHLVEDKVKGGTLDQIEPCRTALANPILNNETIYYEFNLLPEWPVSLSELLAVALKFGKTLGREGYSADDHKAVVEYRETIAKPNHEKHLVEWGPRVIQQKPPPQEELPF